MGWLDDDSDTNYPSRTRKEEAQNYKRKPGDPSYDPDARNRRIDAEANEKRTGAGRGGQGGPSKEDLDSEEFAKKIVKAGGDPVQTQNVIRALRGR